MKNLYLEQSLGIDIREESVSIVLLARGFRTVEVLGGQFFQIPHLAVADEKAEKFFLDKVNRFLMEHDIWPENVVLSIPRNNLTFQSFDLPAPDKKSVHSMVEFELERHFSSGLEGLYHASHISARSENLFNVTSVAVKKETANYYLELVHKLGLKTSTLDVSTFVNYNLVMVNSANKEEICAIVDPSPGAIDISIVKNRIIEFTRHRLIDDPNFRKGYFKSDLPEDHYRKLSQGTSEIIIDELQTALSSCSNIDDSESIETIYLVGGGPYALFLAEQLEKSAEVPTSRVQVFATENSKLSREFTSAYMATAFSLGMRELKRNKIEADLLPAELKPKKRKFNVKTTLALTAALVLLLIGFSVNKIIYKNRTLDSLSKQLEEIKGQTGSLEKIDLEYNSLKEYVTILNAITQTHPVKLPALIELSKTLPPDTWLKTIKISGDRMEIRGYSSAASRLVPLLEKSAHFKEAGFVGTIVREAAGEKFTLKIGIQGSP